MSLIRSLSSGKNDLFLTFDDGPDPTFTRQVLKQLASFGAKATFFVIAQKAEKAPELIFEILEQGHTIGNHSLDHKYSNFFKNDNDLKRWILSSHEKIEQITSHKPIGFRSPAGVVTPPLKRVMKQLDIPWIHWNKRYFDTIFPFSWTQSFRNLNSGDIVLLHDCQRGGYQKSFEKGLENLLGHYGEKGFTFKSITRERL